MPLDWGLKPPIEVLPQIAQERANWLPRWIQQEGARPVTRSGSVL
jgi:hypothetical protein